jgi:2-polyprenyl-3-methyl-5-hydroxy-6-metoxy-1,4-benzoquinol methylase
MSRKTQTLSPDYFEDLYASNIDPWRFASSDYERDKYAQTLAALPEARFHRALEVGCSIGVLTHQLAGRCEHLLAVDAALAPLGEARRRCGDLAHVEFAQMFVPRQWPEGQFDLILLSEVVYYLDAADVDKLAASAFTSLAPRGSVVLVHWIGKTNYPLTGDQAAELFIARLKGLVEVIRRERRKEYRLDVVTRR